MQFSVEARFTEAQVELCDDDSISATLLGKRFSLHALRGEPSKLLGQQMKIGKCFRDLSLKGPPSKLSDKWFVSILEPTSFVMHITIHMPQKWNLSSSVKCIFCRTRENRILVKMCIVFIANCHAQWNQKLRIVIIERNYREKLKPVMNLVYTVSMSDSKRCFHSCVKWKPVKVRNCRECEVVIYCILITTRNAKSHSVTSKTRNAYLK